MGMSIFLISMETRGTFFIVKHVGRPFHDDKYNKKRKNIIAHAPHKIIIKIGQHY